MKTNTVPTTHSENPHLVSTLAKGMLFWGPAYAVASSTTAYGLTVGLTDKTPSYSDILIEALMIFQVWGLVGGTVKWIVISRDTKQENRRKRKRLMFTKGRILRLRPKHA